MNEIVWLEPDPETGVVMSNDGRFTIFPERTGVRLQELVDGAAVSESYRCAADAKSIARYRHLDGQMNQGQLKSVAEIMRRLDYRRVNADPELTEWADSNDHRFKIHLRLAGQSVRLRAEGIPRPPGLMDFDLAGVMHSRMKEIVGALAAEGFQCE